MPHVPPFQPADLRLAVSRRFDQEEGLRHNELAAIAAFAHLFIGKPVYHLTDPIDGSVCQGVLASVLADGGGVSIVVANPERAQVGRRGGPRVHFAAGLNWVTLTAASRSEALTVYGHAGRETNAAVAYAVSRGLPVTRNGQPVLGIRPGPVLLHGATVYLPDFPHPVFPVLHRLEAPRSAYPDCWVENATPAARPAPAAPPAQDQPPVRNPAQSAAQPRPGYRFRPTARAC